VPGHPGITPLRLAHGTALKIDDWDYQERLRFTGRIGKLTTALDCCC
jgi:hypothetical protein